ncbi:interferon-induced protein with tetratricopeptide repeats 1B-like [Anguilla anguilla]|uniref:interferon-induced protein with tetratricopeptide repeats 1B-like n=1 Tax=Anguilla anguilla TaxID=7936 RepID=UPI0015AC5630|nr:interferon-induced protein with tetratricopeptide repeats 1B-like [Anguilla anguilla]XP_035259320.1 interferon-induced protein with tetratricopeptide repeats 1B-like [Anguilla anguilla]XP_035259325.1 interferon-induced protein with tetratricopeptide repeats 1B-like [Anguilla anguilla]XP_035261434.1 interferon-induced protein with tetratricopeptide repeats 1B-like [Anguilla anguilla]
MASTENMLLTKLRQLECHFTWELNYTHLNDLQIRLKNEIELASEKDKNIGWFYGNLAFTKYMQRLLEKARDDLTKAEEHIRKQHGDNCEKQLIVTYGNFAWVYYHKGEHEKSQTYLDKLEGIKKKFPTESPSALHPETYGEKGNAFMKFFHQYNEKAKECFEKAVELEPEEIAWNEGYAVALYRTESNLTSFEESPASRQLRRVLELDPNNAHIMALLGLKHADYEEYQKAEELMERAMKLDPDKPYVIQYVAKFYRKIGKVEESIALLKRALEITPDSALLHHQLALSYGWKTANNEETEDLSGLRIQHLEQAISLKPSFVLAMVELGRVYAEIRDNRKAEEMFKKAIEAANDSNEYHQIAYLKYANFLLYQERSVPMAVVYYKKGLQLQKDTTQWNVCARRLEKIANDKISRNPIDGEAFGILGYVNQMRGDTHQAIECYEKAILYDPANEEYQTALFDLCLSLQ